MARIAFGIEYCGSDFIGWQTQDQGRTVQQAVEKALSIVADHAVTVQCAGRTDTGVHALHQVAHMDTEADRKMHSWILGANVNLPLDVNICWAMPVEDDFHARFSAIKRSYRYIILNRSARSSVVHNKVSWEARYLDEKLMARAAEYLVGEHDFSSYRAVACQAKSPMRTISRLELFRKENYIVIDIEANAFLHHMVRNIAGVLMEIGMGKRPVEWAKEVLDFRDRTRGGETAPADGLYLTDVEYPEQFSIPKANASQWPLCL